jgi:hypothetical protein
MNMKTEEILSETNRTLGFTMTKLQQPSVVYRILTNTTNFSAKMREEILCYVVKYHKYSSMDWLKEFKLDKN